MFGMNGWCKEIPGGDLISRAAAIDELNKGAWGVEWDKTLAKTMIESLPSARPEIAERTAETAQNVSDSDLISRKAAIDAIRASTSKYTGFMEMEMYTDDDAVEAIEALPSAQPERNTGEWREHIFDGIMGRRPRALMCTHCNVISMYASNFCPNCGADMREVDE